MIEQDIVDPFAERLGSAGGGDERQTPLDAPPAVPSRVPYEPPRLLNAPADSSKPPLAEVCPDALNHWKLGSGQMCLRCQGFAP